MNNEFTNAWLMLSSLPSPIFWFILLVLMGAVIAFPVWAYYEFFAKPRPQSGVIRTATVENGGTLPTVFEFTSEKGSPLVWLSPQNKKQKRSDPWREGNPAWRVSNEDRGLVIGVSGSGKTTFLLAQLIDWMQSGQSFVCTDVKPEIWAILKENGVFERYGYTDYVINPTNENADKYNLFSEVADSAELNEILSIIIPEVNGETAVFANNARRLLKAVLLELGAEAGLPSAKKFINDAGDDTNELIRQLKNSKNTTVSEIAQDVKRTADNERLLGSIMNELTGSFEFLDDQRIKNAISSSDFRLKEVLLKPKQALFLQFDQAYKNTTAKLFGATVAHVLRILQLNHTQRKTAVFVALDEIINCAPIPKFTESLNTMRSSNMPTFLYLQTLKGLDLLYGAQASEIFLSAANLKIVFRLNDNATAKYFSELIGKAEVTNWHWTQNSSTNGLGNSQGRSYSESKRLEIIIEPSEFLKLKQNQAVVLYKGGFGKLAMSAYYRDFPTSESPVVNSPQSKSLGEIVMSKCEKIYFGASVPSSAYFGVFSDRQKELDANGWEWMIFVQKPAVDGTDLAGTLNDDRNILDEITLPRVPNIGCEKIRIVLIRQKQNGIIESTVCKLLSPLKSDSRKINSSRVLKDQDIYLKSEKVEFLLDKIDFI